MKLNNLIVKITLYLLMGLSIIIGVVFYVSGISELAEGVKAAKDLGLDVAQIESKYTYYLNILLSWGLVLLGLCASISLIFQIVDFIKKLISEPMAALKSLLLIVFLGVIVLVSWSMADPMLIEIVNYSGSDLTEFWMVSGDTLLYSVYILVGLTFFSLVVTAIYGMIR